MCYYMGVQVSKVQIIQLLKIEKDLGTLAALKELEQMKDGFTFSNSLIVRKTEGKEDIEMVSAHWEFIPVWINTMEALIAARKQGIPWLNATSEKLLESKMYRNAALNRRCLVLATHFYEWRHYKPEGAKKDTAYPYLIEAEDGNYFYMAGIWQPWTDKETGETIDTFAIITTKANTLMQAVHNKKKRMPTILPQALAHEWIMADLSEDRIKEIAAYQISSNSLVAYPIAKDFKLLENPTAAFEYKELPPLIITE